MQLCKNQVFLCLVSLRVSEHLNNSGPCEHEILLVKGARKKRRQVRAEERRLALYGEHALKYQELVLDQPCLTLL